jgi:hypothetical protein
LNVKRLSVAVIAIARVTFANMAADFGVLLNVELFFGKIISPALGSSQLYLPLYGISRHFERQIQQQFSDEGSP